MKTIDNILDELKELQAILKAISWIEAKRPNLDLEAERKTVVTKRSELFKELCSRG